jgi:S-adenosylmethionine-diacylglycerol 3-amino-3-carboxypropyl transferase
VRWLTQQPASLFGLGIPPAQYEALCAGEAGGMAAVLKQRLEKLACDFAIRDNYFAQQAFGRAYAIDPKAALPPYLEAPHYAALTRNVGRASIHHCNYVDYLARHETGRFDRYVLLDAQDWMTDAQLNHLWSEITRTSRPGARVIFRTAATQNLLPGRVAGETLAHWRYEAERSHDYTRRDRSAIYGAFHLYVRADG